MKIYFLRHAIAAERTKKSYPNDDRPLTKEGIRKMKDSSIGLRKIVRSVDVIVSSPLIRAVDTAKIAAKALKYKHNIVICNELLPSLPTNQLIQYLSRFKASASIMAVGHEPSLSLAALALLGSKDSFFVLKKGGLCCIDVSDFAANNPGTLTGLFTAKHLRMLSDG